MGCDAIPRKAPTKVTEHRVTLGNYERQQLEEYLDDVKFTNTMSSIGDVIAPFGQLLGYAGLGVGIAFGLNTFQNQVMNDWWVRFTQERTYNSPTGTHTDIEGNPLPPDHFDDEFITDNFLTTSAKKFWNTIFGYDRY